MYSLAIYQAVALCDPAAHRAPRVPFTVSQAHEIVQIHVACRAKQWPRKAAAQDTLVAAGRLVLSSTKPRWGGEIPLDVSSTSTSNAVRSGWTTKPAPSRSGAWLMHWHRGFRSSS